MQSWSPFIFFIYIKDPIDEFHLNNKLFADNKSLFSLVHDENLTTKDLNDGL